MIALMRFRNLSPLDFYWIVFVAFALLFPLACYCVTMANVNGRRHPKMFSGMADFAGVLLAIAGFLVVGGPLLLSGIHELWRRQTLSGSLTNIREALHQSNWPWPAIWVGYFVLVVGGSAWLLFRRRKTAVIYNIEAADAQELLPDVLRRLNRPFERRGDDFIIESDHSHASAAILHVAIVPSMRNMTLKWLFGEPKVRQLVSDEIRRAISELVSPSNPVSTWLLTIATGVFAVLLVLLGLFVAVIWQIRG